MSTSVIVADDHGIVREGIVSLLSEDQDVNVVAEANNGREAVRESLRLRPDVVILDVSMSELNGPEAACQIKDSLPTTQIIGLSMHSDERCVQRMFTSGARAYVLKESAFSELRQAVRAVVRGERYISARLAGQLAYAHVRNLCAARSNQCPLSAREREVLQLLSEGHCTKDVANRLHVSVKTVESHRRNLKDKLGCRSVADLTKYAIREGLTTLEG